MKICPVYVISQESIRFLNLYHLCKNFSVLPEAGGLFDQENQIVEAFEIISSTSNMIENEEQKKARAKTPQQGQQQGIKPLRSGRM